MLKTKHCRVCDVVLTTKNKYRPRSRTKGNGSICYPCHLAINRARYKSRMKNKTVYIEEKHYPRTRVVQKLSEQDSSRWRMSRSFSDISEFLQGRKFFTSRFGSRPAREGFPSKVGTRVGTIVLVRQNHKVTKQYQHQVCDECGSNDIRLDSRGYKYCTQCFLIQ